MTAQRDDRLARVALNRLAEPGDPRLAPLVAELGAVRVRDHLMAERDLQGMLTDVAARLDRRRARAGPRPGRPARSPFRGAR